MYGPAVRTVADLLKTSRDGDDLDVEKGKTGEGMRLCGREGVRGGV